MASKQMTSEIALGIVINGEECLGVVGWGREQLELPVEGIIAISRSLFSCAALAEAMMLLIGALGVPSKQAATFMALLAAKAGEFGIPGVFEVHPAGSSKHKRPAVRLHCGTTEAAIGCTEARALATDWLAIKFAAEADLALTEALTRAGADVDAVMAEYGKIREAGAKKVDATGYSAAPPARDVERQRADEAIALADGDTRVPDNLVNAPLPESRTGQHLWAMIAVYQVDDPETATDRDGHARLGVDSLRTIQGPMCFACGRPYSKKTARKPCPGHDHHRKGFPTP